METNFKIEFQATNKMIKQAHKADKARAASRNEILRAFACGNVGNLDGDLAAESSKLLDLAIKEADKRQAADILAKYPQATNAATAAEVEEALNKVKEAATVEAQAETTAKEATKAHNEAKRKAKAAAELAAEYVRLAKRGQATAAEVETKQANAETAHAAEVEAGKVEAKAAEALGKARNKAQAAADALETAKAKAAKALVVEAFKAANAQHITAANCHESKYFRGFLLKAFNETIATIDGRYFKWCDIASNAIETAEILTCNNEARLKVGAKAVAFDALPVWDNSRKFTAADVVTTSDNGKAQILRLYFRDEESGEVYQVTGRKDEESGVKVVINTAVYTEAFSPLALLDCLKYYLAPSTAAKAKADKAQAKAEAEEAEEAAETSGNQSKASRTEFRQSLAETADKLQEMN